MIPWYVERQAASWIAATALASFVVAARKLIKSAPITQLYIQRGGVAEGSQAVKLTLRTLFSAICRVFVDFTKKPAEDLSSQFAIFLAEAGQHKPVSTTGMRLYRFKEFAPFC